MSSNCWERWQLWNEDRAWRHLKKYMQRPLNDKSRLPGSFKTSPRLLTFHSLSTAQNWRSKNHRSWRWKRHLGSASSSLSLLLPWFRIIPYIIFSLPALVQFSRSSLSPGCHLWGMMLGVPSSLSWQRERLPLPPVDIREPLCWWSQLRGGGWLSPCCLGIGGLSRQRWGAFCVWWHWTGDKDPGV